MRPTALVAVAAPLLFAAGRAVPKFEPDPCRPKPLPNNWMVGQVSGIFVDARDHIWVTNRPVFLEGHDKYSADGKADCSVAVPPVLDFDAAGSLIRGWGGPGPGCAWPDKHGMFVDYKENVWIGGNGAKDTHILKFNKTGKFLLQIGYYGNSGGSNDTENLNRPVGMVVCPKTNEVFVADGDGNRRVIVFDRDTGAYKRHWRAYGNKPSDSVPRTRNEGPGRNSSIPSMAFASPTANWCMWATA
jgi:DNA-binding beta-propeller fold protein YncE